MVAKSPRDDEQENCMITQEQMRAYSAELQRISEMMSEVAQLRDAVHRRREGIGNSASSACPVCSLKENTRLNSYGL